MKKKFYHNKKAALSMLAGLLLLLGPAASVHQAFTRPHSIRRSYEYEHAPPLPPIDQSFDLEENDLLSAAGMILESRSKEWLEMLEIIFGKS